MKKNIHVSSTAFIVILISFLSFWSCSNSSNSSEENPNPLNNPAITATINGTAWHSYLGLAQAQATGFKRDSVLMQIIGSNPFDKNVHAITFIFPKMETGTFTFNTTADNIIKAAHPNGEWETFNGKGSGQLTILTSEPKRITGTFWFNAVNKDSSKTPLDLIVTNGKFDLFLFE